MDEVYPPIELQQVHPDEVTDAVAEVQQGHSDKVTTEVIDEVPPSKELQQVHPDEVTDAVAEVKQGHFDEVTIEVADEVQQSKNVAEPFDGPSFDLRLTLSPSDKDEEKDVEGAKKPCSLVKRVKQNKERKSKVIGEDFTGDGRKKKKKGDTGKQTLVDDSTVRSLFDLKTCRYYVGLEETHREVIDTFFKIADSRLRSYRREIVKWTNAYDGKTIEVYDPATGDVIANLACMGRRETSDAISSASEGAVNVVMGNASEIGDTILESPQVRKITFTGSTAVGKKLMAGAVGTVKKVSLELGGNAPCIVFDDADLDLAVKISVSYNVTSDISTYNSS
ncbi:hypothetical protein IFM89_014350 [Coptis chinensis]|uniref:Aldehyde dehydrogenase domain-containing protein n=1 Tax=Coptis chinensis TaxID=261450 RepID=A0A835IMM3_9MAGN|nr:hypothetical protein IFM89_014350 [Coptis chinensis]